MIGPLDWQNRQHFIAVATNVMRHLLVNHASAQVRHSEVVVFSESSSKRRSQSVRIDPRRCSHCMMLSIVSRN